MGGGGSQQQNQHQQTWGQQSQTDSSVAQLLKLQQQQQQQQTAQNQQGQTSSVATSSVAAGQQPNVDLLLSGARDNYLAGQNNSALTAARAQQGQFVSGAGQNLVGAALAGDTALLNPNYITNPTSSPVYQSIADSLTGQTNRALTEGALPAIRQSAVNNNTLGGSKQGISEGLAVGRAMTGLNDTLASTALNVQGQNLAAYNAAAGRAGTDFNLGLMPGETAAGLATAPQDEQNRRLQVLQALTGTQGTYGGTSTQQGTDSATNTSVSNLIDNLLNAGQTATKSQSDAQTNSASNTNGNVSGGGGDGTLQAIGGILSLVAAFL